MAVFQSKLKNDGEKTEGVKISEEMKNEIRKLSDIQRPANTNLEQINTDFQAKEAEI
jgi:hypothetical protein